MIEIYGHMQRATDIESTVTIDHTTNFCGLNLHAEAEEAVRVGRWDEISRLGLTLHDMYKIVNDKPTETATWQLRGDIPENSFLVGVDMEIKKNGKPVNDVFGLDFLINSDGVELKLVRWGDEDEKYVEVWRLPYY